MTECNYLMSQFLDMCKEINFPISVTKTEWATLHIVFLGILLDGVHLTLSIPLEKRGRKGMSGSKQLEQGHHQRAP